MMSNRAPSLKTSSFRFYVLILLVNSCLLLFYIVYVVNYSTSLQLLPVPSNQFYVELNEKDLGRIERNLRLYRRKQFERIQRNRNESRLRRAVSHIDYDWWHKSNNQLPYFFANGSIRPNDHDKRYHRLAIWPDQVDHDRILNQLMYVPINYSSVLKSKRMKRIYIHNPNHSFNIRDVPSGRKRFLIDRCPVNTCEIVRNRYEAHLADAIVFKDYVSSMWFNRPANQVWIYYNLESSANTPMAEYANLINWTATYRSDSDLVTPYGKFVLYSGQSLPVESSLMHTPTRNVSATKIRSIAWFASNCLTRNGRIDFVRKLRNYVQVDIYGRCGELKCARSQSNECFGRLKREYKFYLALENSNCIEYITEKLFLNAYQNDVIPIVFGARYEDYMKVAPPDSYLHVEDFESIHDLAMYLRHLDRDESLYDNYFRWQTTGEFINTFFWCRLCAMLHAPSRPKFYPDLGKWWNNKTTCKQSAKKPTRSKKLG